jgi:vacuolar-type H+-ATPase subunit I/STV1
MSNARQAAEGAQNLAKMYKSVLDIAVVLGAIADIESATDVAISERDAARVQAEDAKQTLTVLLGKLTEADERLQSLRRDGDSVINAAEESARSIVASAERGAQEMRDAARAEVAGIRLALEDERLDRNGALSELNRQINDKRETLDAINTELAAARARLGFKE